MAHSRRTTEQTLLTLKRNIKIKVIQEEREKEREREIYYILVFNIILTTIPSWPRPCPTRTPLVERRVNYPNLTALPIKILHYITIL